MDVPPDVAAILALAIVIAFLMSVAIGANDVANAFGTAVGSKALTLKQVVILGAIFEFTGALALGGSVSSTVQGGVLDPSKFEARFIINFMIGMAAILAGAAVWLAIATFFALPVSTTHTVIGGLVAFSLLVAEPEHINWEVLVSVVLSWVISPLMGGLIAYGLFFGLKKTLLDKPGPFVRSQQHMPWYTGLTTFIFVLFLVYNGIPGLDLNVLIAIGVSAGGSCLAFLISKTVLVPRTLASLSTKSRYAHITSESHSLMAKNEDDEQSAQGHHHTLEEEDEEHGHDNEDEDTEYHQKEMECAEEFFVPLMVFTASLISFAHGANDVANAVGPLFGVWTSYQSIGGVTPDTSTPVWALAIGGVGIVLGLAAFGRRVIETVGSKITKMTHTRGFCAQLATSTTVLLASWLGLPVSTTHVMIGAVSGVGLVDDPKGLNTKVLANIGISWAITLPAGAIVTIILYYAFCGMFGAVTGVILQ